MSHVKKNYGNTHPVAKMYAQELKEGKLNRREFISRATALGLTASTAYALGGLSQPAFAGGHLQQGGTMRMQMDILGLKDPRTFDWTQLAQDRKSVV